MFLSQLIKVCVRKCARFSRIALVAFSMSVLMVGGCAGPNTMEKAGKYVDDSAITTKVKAMLVKDPDVSAIEIQVTTVDGVVQLSGFVSTDEERQKAEMLTKEIEGVQSVDNVIALK